MSFTRELKEIIEDCQWLECEDNWIELWHEKEMTQDEINSEHTAALVADQRWDAINDFREERAAKLIQSAWRTYRAKKSNDDNIVTSIIKAIETVAKPGTIKVESCDDPYPPGWSCIGQPSRYKGGWGGWSYGA
jgi:hypothetical protein